MKTNRTASEELVFKTAELDTAMREAGFHLAYSDPEAARDFSYRARYIRSKTTLFPLLSANLEYYLATKTYSLVISTSDEYENRIYYCRVKQHSGDLKALLEQYLASVRRGVPLEIEEKKRP